VVLGEGVTWRRSSDDGDDGVARWRVCGCRIDDSGRDIDVWVLAVEYMVLEAVKWRCLIAEGFDR
jgi:hypothetical protein